MTKHAQYSEFVERYLDCPYCGVLISDYENITEGDTIEADQAIKCPRCGKSIVIDGES